MNRLLVFVFIILSCATFAADKLIADKLLGTWKRERTSPSVSVVGYTEYLRDGRCLQVARRTAGDQEQWMFIESTWGLGEEMWQEIVRSNNPQLTPGRKSTATLIEVTDDRMIYNQQGQRIEEARAKMPTEFRAKLDAFLSASKG